MAWSPLHCPPTSPQINAVFVVGGHPDNIYILTTVLSACSPSFQAFRFELILPRTTWKRPAIPRCSSQAAIPRHVLKCLPTWRHWQPAWCSLDVHGVHRVSRGTCGPGNLTRDPRETLCKYNAVKSGILQGMEPFWTHIALSGQPTNLHMPLH